MTDPLTLDGDVTGPVISPVVPLYRKEATLER